VNSFDEPLGVVDRDEGAFVSLDDLLSGFRHLESLLLHHLAIMHLELSILRPLLDLLDRFTVEQHRDQIVDLEVYRVRLDLPAFCLLLMELLKAGRCGAMRARSLHVLDRLWVLPLILLVVVGILPKLARQGLILVIVVFRVPELFVDPLDEDGIDFLSWCSSHLPIETIIHGLQ
jgi:hypothetical protein